MKKTITMTEERLDQIITRSLSKGQLIVAEIIAKHLQDETCTKEDLYIFCDNFIEHGNICLGDTNSADLYEMIKDTDNIDYTTKH